VYDHLAGLSLDDPNLTADIAAGTVAGFAFLCPDVFTELRR
jgi:hypothetical protein